MVVGILLRQRLSTLDNKVRPQTRSNKKQAAYSLLPEVITDRRVVLRRLLEGLQRELAAQGLRDIAGLLDPGVEEGVVVGRVGEDGDTLVVLGGSAEELGKV